jgi:hypothetical protein
VALTTFHGCYQASNWTLHADRAATSNCNTTSGYQQFELFGTCHGSGGWERSSFSTLSAPACTGERFLRHDDHYGVWVGAILCGTFGTTTASTRARPVTYWIGRLVPCGSAPHRRPGRPFNVAQRGAPSSDWHS